MTIEEIESRERISDPLGAVPSLPFGHLNAAWAEFKDNLQTGDELRFFSVPWKECWNMELHEGYVVLREEEIGPWFTADVRQVDSSEE